MKKIFLYKQWLWACLIWVPGWLSAQQLPAAGTVPSPDTIAHPPKTFLTKTVDKYLNDTVTNAKKGFFVKPSMTVGAGYRIQKSKTGRQPFDAEHNLSANYALNRGGFFIEYKSLFHQALGKWNLGIIGRADLPNVYNFFGVGNETQMLAHKNSYYRYRTAELYGGLSINRLVDSTHFFEFRPFYQTVRIKMDNDRIIANLPSILNTKEKELEDGKTQFSRDYFAGAEATYHFQKKNNRLVPTKGFDFGLSGAYVVNTKNKDRSFTRYTSSATVYLPLLKTLTLAVRAGGTMLQGQPEFYQLGTLGGSENLRGFNRQRFYGKTTFYNNNELRWLISTNNPLFRKVGLLGFVDQGRVWNPGEVSDKWHVGYGGGIIIVPYDRLVLNGTLGISKEAMVLHCRIGFLF